jgi:hypothetical protein
MTKKELAGGDAADFNHLVTVIQSVHQELKSQASKSVNMALTIRNWLIGFHIAEYELKGLDRAEYGEELLARLAKKLTDLGVETCQKRRLYAYLRFYQCYPEIVRSLSAQFQRLIPESAQSEKVRTPSALSETVENLAYSHFELLVAVDSIEKRAFYQSQCIAGGWSVRELKRQIASLLYEPRISRVSPC